MISDEKWYELLHEEYFKYLEELDEETCAMSIEAFEYFLSKAFQEEETERYA